MQAAGLVGVVAAAAIRRAAFVYHWRQVYPEDLPNQGLELGTPVVALLAELLGLLGLPVVRHSCHTAPAELPVAAAAAAAAAVLYAADAVALNGLQVQPRWEVRDCRILSRVRKS